MKEEQNLMPRQFWDQEVAAFDQEPDHGLHEVVRGAWIKLLKAALPSTCTVILGLH